MNKLPKEKRDRLILVALVTAIVLVGLWFGLIKNQQQSLSALSEKYQQSQQKLKEIENAIAHTDQLESSLAETTEKLGELEDNMASGDSYSWFVQTINRFKLPYHVDIPQFSQPSSGPMTMIPKFPYKQVTITISGNAYFHDFGKFIADFENNFPQIRVERVEMESAQGNTGEPEKLSFKVDLVALVKSSAS